MAVYDTNNKYIADTLRAAGDVLGVSHITVRQNAEKRDNDFYLFRMPTNQVGRPLESKTRFNGLRWYERK